MNALARSPNPATSNCTMCEAERLLWGCSAEGSDRLARRTRLRADNYAQALKHARNGSAASARSILN
eukprot:2740174-Pyramimonas_sp.AAC.1